jgi:hypothetical protein
MRARAVKLPPGGMCLLVLAFAALRAPPALAAGTGSMVLLPPAARVGVISILDAEVTHFHASKRIEDSFLKTYRVNWSVSGMLLASVQPRLTGLGLTAVPLVASDELARAREPCFLDAQLAKGLPRECASLFTRLAAAQQLAAVIVLGPGHNDSAHAGAARHRELPEYLRGWCFVTGEGATGAPPLLDLTELLLITLTPKGAQLADREWDAEGQSWSAYRPPADLKAIPERQLDELEPLFAAMLQRQSDGALAHLQVAR